MPRVRSSIVACGTTRRGPRSSARPIRRSSARRRPSIAASSSYSPRSDRRWRSSGRSLVTCSAPMMCTDAPRRLRRVSTAAGSGRSIRATRSAATAIASSGTFA